jgi:hypothetical protein
MEPDAAARDDVLGTTQRRRPERADHGARPPDSRETLPGKGWFAYFRFYGPTEPFFDKSWALPDFEKVQ